MDRPSDVVSKKTVMEQDHPVVLGFASSRPQALPLLSTTSCPSSPLTRGLRESAFSNVSDKSRTSGAPQEAPRSGADSGESAAGHSSGDEQDAPRMPAACLERTLSGSLPVCIPGDRRRCGARAVERALSAASFPLGVSVSQAAAAPRLCGTVRATRTERACGPLPLASLAWRAAGRFCSRHRAPNGFALACV